MTSDPQGAEIETRLRQIQQALGDLERYEAEVNSGFANGLRAKDWDSEPEVAPYAKERAALLDERERLLRERGP